MARVVLNDLEGFKNDALVQDVEEGTSSTSVKSSVDNFVSDSQSYFKGESANKARNKYSKIANLYNSRNTVAQSLLDVANEVVAELKNYLAPTKIEVSGNGLTRSGFATYEEIDSSSSNKIMINTYIVAARRNIDYMQSSFDVIEKGKNEEGKEIIISQSKGPELKENIINAMYDLEVLKAQLEKINGLDAIYNSCMEKITGVGNSITEFHNNVAAFVNTPISSFTPPSNTNITSSARDTSTSSVRDTSTSSARDTSTSSARDTSTSSARDTLTPDFKTI